MDFDESLQQYTYAYEDLIFVWDELPKENFHEIVEVLADSYHENFDGILDFILPNLREIYGDVTREDVENKIGKPIINPENETVTYCDQSFDSWHIFTFEFSNNNFEDLNYFSVDG
ncbi:hypothetical protein ING2D1G_1501 [Peptoniphilus sp. ING2-D1G]|nr:hypothetical protein ING2D1G_1501 [Peptoniphilus sp. ING2-D1G]